MGRLFSVMFLAFAMAPQFAQAFTEYEISGNSLNCAGTYEDKTVQFTTAPLIYNRSEFISGIVLTAVIDGQNVNLGSATFIMRKSSGNNDPSVAEFSKNRAEIRSTVQNYNGTPTRCPEGTRRNIGCTEPGKDTERWVINLDRSLFGNLSARIQVSSVIFGESTHRLVSIQTSCELK